MAKAIFPNVTLTAKTLNGDETTMAFYDDEIEEMAQFYISIGAEMASNTLRHDGGKEATQRVLDKIAEWFDMYYGGDE